MSTEVAKAKRTFIVVTVVCSILFGIPFILWLLRIASGLFGSEVSANYYREYHLYGHVLYAMLLAALALIPPILAYFYYDKRRSTFPTRNVQEAQITPGLESAPSNAIHAGKTDWGQVLLYTIITGIGITFIGLVYAEAMRRGFPAYGEIDGLSVAWSWISLILGIAFAWKLKKWSPVGLGVCCLFLALLPIVGPIVGWIFVGWLYFQIFSEHDRTSGKDSSTSTTTDSPDPGRLSPSVPSNLEGPVPQSKWSSSIPTTGAQASAAQFEEGNQEIQSVSPVVQDAVPKEPQEAPRRCSYCGAEMRFDRQWCEDCGRSIAPAVVANAIMSHNEPEKEKEPNWGLIGALSIVLPIAVLGGLSLLGTSTEREPATEKPSVPIGTKPQQQSQRLRSIELKDTEHQVRYRVTDATKTEALISFSEQGDATVVDQLLAFGADPNAKNHDGSTPLILAAWAGHMETVQYLIQRGANVNAKTESGHTALTRACMNGHADIAQLLLKNGANPNCETSQGFTPLFLARENPQVKEVLLQHGAKE